MCKASSAFDLNIMESDKEECGEKVIKALLLTRNTDNKNNNVNL